MTASNSQRFEAMLQPATNRGARVVVPFDPDEVWGVKREHRICGSVADMGVRGSITNGDDGWSFTIGPAWLRDCPISVGDHVVVVVFPEGPQRGDLAPDLARALADNPAAAECFDALAQFYRKAYLRWIDATKRRPDLRTERIREVVDLLANGVKERPVE